MIQASQACDAGSIPACRTKHLKSKHIIFNTTTFKDMYKKHIDIYKTLYKIDLKDMILI